MAKIVLENITKVYHNTVAVNNINIDCKDGEFLVILGPSGAGKTTIMNLISGVEDLSEGNIYMNDKIINKIEPRYRNITYAFENYSLYPHLNVFDNISSSLRSPVRKNNYTEKQVCSMVNDIAEKLHINEFLNRNINHLSGGQKQRVVLARALVRESDLCLLDEAIAHLDAKLRHLTRAILKGIQSQKKVTTIYATPDLIEALSMGDRVVVLHNGTLQQFDTPTNIYKYPNNIFVAALFSEPSMNMFEANLHLKDNKILVNLNGFDIIMPSQAKELLIERKSIESGIIFGVRPNDIFIIENERSNNKINNNLEKLSGEVKRIEYLGDEFIYDVEIDNLLFKISSEKDINININDIISIYFNINGIFLFDKYTENRIWPKITE